MEPDDALVTVDGFLPAIGNDFLLEPFVQPLTDLVLDFCRGDAAIQFCQDFAQPTLGVGFLSPDRFRLANTFAIGVTAQEHLDFPGA